MRRLTTWFCLLLAIGMLLGACQAPAPAMPEPPAAQATEAPLMEATPTAAESTPTVETEAMAGAGTLVVWDQFYRAVESEVIDTLNREFVADHPGISIDRVSRVLDDLSATVRLALGEPNGPDVSQVNQGRLDMGALVQAGYLLPLDRYAQQYGWRERFSESVLNRNQFSADGVVFGEGNLYGISPTAEVVGVYYNKQKFAAHGWQVPETFEAFQQLLADIKAAGETPISFGNLDGWPGIHMYSSVQHVFAELDYINDLVFALGDQSWVSEPNRRAAEVMQEWVQQGYFTEGFEGIGYDDSSALFKSGDGVLMVTGSWLAPELVGGEADFGFFLMPQEEGDETQLAIGGVGVPYAIRATTVQPDLAAEYLNWMVSDRAAQLWAEASYVPAMPLPGNANIEEGSLFADTVAAWNRLLEDNGVGHYIDWATPTMYDTLVAELQKLFARQTTPQQFLEAVQADYAGFLAEQ